jgi:hypothetical protein
MGGSIFITLNLVILIKLGGLEESFSLGDFNEG